jgi:hypothetical protein
MKTPYPLGFAFLLLSPLALAAPPPEVRPILLQRLPVDEQSPAWEDAQIVAADRAGHVYFLRGATFEVYPVTKSGSFGEPVRLETTTAPNQMVHDAVLSPGGDRWLIYGDLAIRLFVDGKEKAVPPIPWKPWSITLRRDTPVVAVLPLPMGGRSVDLEKVGAPPTFLEFDGKRWNPVLEKQGVSVADLVRQGGRLNDAIAEQSVYLTADRQGRLWSAGQYRYRLQRFTPGLQPNLELLVGGGDVQRKEKRAPSEGIQMTRTNAARNPTEATQNPLKEKETYHPFDGEAVVLDLTEGRDGRLYLLVRTKDGGAAIDRFDSALLALQRTPVDLKAQGRFTLAAGRDALYIAAWNGKQGRWRIAWEDLEQAPWRDVEDAELDGLPLASGDKGN